MQDEHQPFTEYAPTWKRIDPKNPPKARKMLFKDDFGGACVGVWYEGCNWKWYCGLPKHSEADKADIRARSSGTDGRFSDGKPYEAT
jgi:hypothetical protein